MELPELVVYVDLGQNALFVSNRTYEEANDLLTASAPSIISLGRQLSHELKKGLRLPNKGIHVHKALQSSYGSSVGGRGTYDRTYRQSPVEECCRFGHDQVGL
jgi:hypothetical protein